MVNSTDQPARLVPPGPFAVLRLEMIADNMIFSRRTFWVAEITGTHARYGLRRKFLSFAIDYSKANSVGSRGVEAIYVLAPTAVYEVKSPESWTRIDQYFCEVVDGEIARMDKEEAWRKAEALQSEV